MMKKKSRDESFATRLEMCQGANDLPGTFGLMSKGPVLSPASYILQTYAEEAAFSWPRCHLKD